MNVVLAAVVLVSTPILPLRGSYLRCRCTIGVVNVVVVMVVSCMRRSAAAAMLAPVWSATVVVWLILWAWLRIVDGNWLRLLVVRSWC